MENCAIREVSTLLISDFCKNINQSLRVALSNENVPQDLNLVLCLILAFKILQLALLNMSTYMFQNIKLTANECRDRSKTLQCEINARVYKG
jgi:hypothetical protein